MHNSNLKIIFVTLLNLLVIIALFTVFSTQRFSSEELIKSSISPVKFSQPLLKKTFDPLFLIDNASWKKVLQKQKFLVPTNNSGLAIDEVFLRANYNDAPATTIIKVKYKNGIRITREQKPPYNLVDYKWEGGIWRTFRHELTYSSISRPWEEWPDFDLMESKYVEFKATERGYYGKENSIFIPAHLWWEYKIGDKNSLYVVFGRPNDKVEDLVLLAKEISKLNSIRYYNDYGLIPVNEKDNLKDYYLDTP